MEKDFIRVRSVKDIVIFTSFIVLGAVLIALPTGAGVNITGFFLIFAGLILSLVLRTGHKDESTGESFQKKELYFQQAMRADILSVIETAPSSVDLSQEDKGNALKIDIYYNKSLNKAYLQVFEYVPYKYQPCSKLYEHKIDKVAALIK